MPQHDVLLCAHWAYVTQAHRAYIDLKPPRSQRLDVEAQVKRPIQNVLEQQWGQAVPVPTFWIGADKWRSPLHVKPDTVRTFAIGKKLNRCYTVCEATNACIVYENYQNKKGEKRSSDPPDLVLSPTTTALLPPSLSPPLARPDLPAPSDEEVALLLDLMAMESDTDETEGTNLMDFGSSMEASDSNSDLPDVSPVALDEEPLELMDMDMPLIDSSHEWGERMRAETAHEDNGSSVSRSSMVRSASSGVRSSLRSIFRRRSIGTWSSGSSRRLVDGGNQTSATARAWLQSAAGRAAQCATGWTLRPEDDGRMFVAVRIFPGLCASTRVEFTDVLSSAVANFSAPNPGTSLEVDRLLSSVSD